jgi:hypothetical protein
MYVQAKRNCLLATHIQANGSWMCVSCIAYPVQVMIVWVGNVVGRCVMHYPYWLSNLAKCYD